MQNWYVYIVRCADGSFYTGVTTDPRRREREHNESDRCAARYTRARRPVRLVWLEPQVNRSAALKREYAIKRLSRAAKDRLVATFAPGGLEVPLAGAETTTAPQEGAVEGQAPS